MSSQSNLTNLLVAFGKGERTAFDKLMPQVYDQLKVMASARLRSERQDHTLNTTGLVNEAFLKLVDLNEVEFKDRAHFFALASRQMRWILVDWSKKRNAALRNPKNKVEINEAMAISADQAETVLELENALESLAKNHPRVAEVVELTYYGGLKNQEVADAKGVGLATIERDLRFGRAWLSKEWKGDIKKL